jgi:hypothetical protein
VISQGGRCGKLGRRAASCDDGNDNHRDAQTQSPAPMSASSFPRSSFLLDRIIDLRGRTSGIVGQAIPLEPGENGPGATSAGDGLLSFAGRQQPRHRFASVGDDHLSAWTDLISFDSRFLASKILTCTSPFLSLYG